MFRTFPAARPLAATAVVLVAAACATVPSTRGSKGERATSVVMIDNTANDISEMTVTLVPEFGVPRMLGTVRHDEMKSFVVEPDVAGASYRLIAKPLGGRAVASESFNLSPGDRFEWDLRLNGVFYRGRSVES